MAVVLSAEGGGTRGLFGKSLLGRLVGQSRNSMDTPCNRTTTCSHYTILSNAMVNFFFFVVVRNEVFEFGGEREGQGKMVSGLRRG